MSERDDVVFNEEIATQYDAQRRSMAPLKDALHYFMRHVLAPLPETARFLCVGAGTGDELLAMAAAFPRFSFVAVDPAAPMLEQASRRVAAAGIADRCVLHEGTVDSYPSAAPFDGASTILVSQFVVDRDARRAFYAAIASRLRPGAILVSADIAVDPVAEDFRARYEPWHRMLDAAGMGMPFDDFVSKIGKGISVLPPEELRTLITTAGFDAPIPFYQALLIQAVYARRRG